MASPTLVSFPAARISADSVTAAPAPAAPAATADAVRPAHATTDADGRSAPDDSPARTAAAVQELVDVLKTTSIGLRFEIDENTHRVITKVIDKETGELIRQMPSAEVMRFAQAIDKLQGLFISHAV
ncbi:flagellar protein FlaG [Cupriavidus sp. YR651]|uniref:flagellar protein FlaG n=1 Tax=Cupriavidus sp. YR651 TaxID=1855315 RepID=UPI000885FCC9|nr:flagellar protein FlaG [Cupriavidus sp. YR651]SDC64097.1 flagellar protein FlaG [Cupriavidus sp. YR651]